ncbi:MAG: right-handed parallel beta-helix repeat-containing protein [Planctomycetota bacterium]
MKLLTSCIAAVAVSAAAAGPLTPPAGPVSPTGKTTDQIEPRTPIDPSQLPIVIAQSGSYYLTGPYNYNGPADGHAITITTSAVTIDLNGFRLNGNSGASHAIEVGEAVSYSDIRIRNGTIASWGGSAVSAVNDEQIILEALYAVSNGTAQSSPAFEIGSFSVIRDCHVDNHVGTAIRLAESSLVDGCTVKNPQAGGIRMASGNIVRNTLISGTDTDAINGMSGNLISSCTITAPLGDGIDLDNNNRIENCTVRSSGSAGILVLNTNSISGCTVSDSFIGIQGSGENSVLNCSINNAGNDGITLTDAASVVNCSVSNAAVDGISVTQGVVRSSSVTECGRYGILASFGTLIDGNAARRNTRAGIRVFRRCRIVNNVCEENVNSAAGSDITLQGYGILASSSTNHVESNTAALNDVGFRIESLGNVVVKNTAIENFNINYSFLNSTSHSFGPIVTGPGQITTTSPYANFSF